MPSRNSLKIGLQLPEAERDVRWPELLDIARTAEDAGFDSLWVGDHLLYRPASRPPVAPWEAWSTLAALAVATSRVLIGPLVASTSFHAPAMIAKKAATIDEISGGRLILGLGAGWNEPEYRAFGFPFDHRVARFEEAFTIIRTLLATGAIDYQGRYYEVENCELLPPPSRPGKIPLMIGSIGERMLRATLPHVDSWNIWYADFGNDPARFGQHNRRITAMCEAMDRDPGTLERTVAALVSVSGGTGRVSEYDPGPPPVPVTGSPEQIARGLRQFADQGAEHLQIVLDPITVAAIHEVAPAIDLARQG